MAQDDRVSKFVTAITKEAEEQRKRIEQETKDYIASEMEKAEMEALNDSYKMIQRAVANIRADVGSQLSRRDEIADSVLTKAADKVKAFAASDRYDGFLAASAKKAAAALGGQRPTVYLRPADMSRKAVITAAIGDCSVKEDKNILLGGLRMVSKKLRPDHFVTIA